MDAGSILAEPADRLDADVTRLRWVASLVGGMVPGVVAVFAWWLGITIVAVIAAAGVPIGAVLAAGAAVRATRPGWGRVVASLALVAPLLAGATLSISFATAGPEQLVFGLLFVTLYAEVFGLPVTLPTALVAVVLLRRLGRMPARRALRRAGSLAAATAVAGIATLLVALGPLAGAASDAGLGPVDWAARTAVVRLSFAIENRTMAPRAVDVVADLGDGSSTGTTVYVDPCETVADRWNMQSATWSLREGDPSEETWGLGTVLASSAGAPGSDPVVLVVLGPADSASLTAGGALPRSGPLDPADCG